METRIPSTSAHGLHEILVQVWESGAQNFRGGWARALGAEWGSSEFARRHAEVTGLLAETIQQVQALPEAQRNRYSRYFPQWWTAVVQPDLNWADAGRPARVLVTQETLDHLASAADLLQSVLGGTCSAPAGSNLDGLRESCDSWLELLAETPNEELAPALRDEIAAQIRHLLWLIDHASLFGTARISREATSVIGTIAQASTGLTGQDLQTGGRWRRGFVAFVAASALLATGVTQLQTAIEAGSGVVKEITQVVESVTGATG
ncbi:hypothetical protein ACIGN6_26485 [Streptomyces sp. NPDC053792]|uniref:hypothetical protein n=1 Tax=Streptomyces sp. NPDC053792 TaxID=3365716 RepID=UPI0037D0293D